ncbi:MAG: BatA and WFA domain-containing protein [Candidatus Hydrogenedentes bacterium]|nr:BatA and WFA domain-containing protein [Candidatus Hydrogenedentota bacterium]
MTAIGNYLAGAFLNPIGFAALGLVPIVILLYLLKLRRTEVVISSTMLWTKSLQDLTANAPFQRLRKNLLLFLQILILVLLAIALARPFVKAEGNRGDNLCVIIDRSASMQTMESGATRMAEARNAALRLVDDMRGGDKMMVVSFAEKADVLCELTDDKFRLRQAIESIEAADTRSNIRDVMLIARSLAPDNPDVEVVVPDLSLILISDGKLSDLAELGSLSMNMNFLQIGATNNNAGITAFSVRAPQAGEERQCFVLAYNDAPEPLTTTLSLLLDGDLLAVEEVSLPATGGQEVVFELPAVESGVLQARIDSADTLGVDNQAWLVLQPDAYLDVLLVTDSDAVSAYFLRRVLGLDPRVELSSTTPTEYTGATAHDLVIFNNWSPPALPQGSLLFVNALPPLSGLQARGAIENPPVLATDPRHPVMRFLNPGNIRVERAIDFALPEGAQGLVTTTNGALVADMSQGGQQIVVIGFDLSESNWPLHLSFPLFIQNLLSWVPRGNAAAEGALQTGQPLELFPRPDTTTVTVIDPAGGRHAVDLDPTRPVYYGGTTQAGVYEVIAGESIERYACNLVDRNESAVTPAESLNLGRTEVVAQKGSVQMNRELWRWLALAALAVLALEWWIYSRRAWL